MNQRTKRAIEKLDEARNALDSAHFLLNHARNDLDSALIAHGRKNPRATFNPKIVTPPTNTPIAFKIMGQWLHGYSTPAGPVQTDREYPSGRFPEWFWDRATQWKFRQINAWETWLVRPEFLKD